MSGAWVAVDLVWSAMMVVWMYLVNRKLDALDAEVQRLRSTP